MFHATANDLPIGFEIPVFNLPARVPNGLAVFAEAVATGPDAVYRITRAFREGGSPQGGSFLIEARAEQLRLAEFAERPSRFTCTFGYRTLPEALHFWTTYRKSGHLFAVEPLGQSAMWCADFGKITIGLPDDAEPAAGMAMLDERLRDYWQTMTRDLSAAPEGWELLVVGPVRITGACQAPH